MRNSFKGKVALFLVVIFFLGAISAAAGMLLNAFEIPVNRVDRISGSNRFRTAVAISQEGWDTFM